MRRKSIRQVVEDPQPDEYYVLVTRYYPMELRKRGLKLADSPIDVWARELAPSRALLRAFKTTKEIEEQHQGYSKLDACKIAWKLYEQSFKKEIPRDFVLRSLAKHKKDAKGKTVVLVCIEEDSEYPKCHTWLLLSDQPSMRGDDNET